MRPLPTASCQPALQGAMNCLARRLGADPPTLVVSSLPAVPTCMRAGKQRRVRSAKVVTCAS